MESKQLSVITPRAFRSGESAYLEITTRNVETLTFTAYKLDPEAYFRKKHAIADVESLDVGLVAPDSEWKAAVPGFKKYAPIAKHYELKSDLKFPGVYVVKVTDEKTLQAATSVLGSDVDAIVKASQTQFLVFAQDMKTGRGRAGARVIVAQGNEIVLEGTTGADGVLLKTWESPRPVGMDLSYLVLGRRECRRLGPAHRLGGGAGADAEGVPRDRSAGVSAGAGRRASRGGPRGRRRPVFGAGERDVSPRNHRQPGASLPIEGRHPVPRSARSTRRSRSTPGLRWDRTGSGSRSRERASSRGAFQVRAYQLEKVALEIRPERPVVFRGDPVKAEIEAKYQYGTPLSGRLILVRLPRRPDPSPARPTPSASSPSSSRPRGSPRSRNWRSRPSCPGTTSPHRPKSPSRSEGSRSTSARPATSILTASRSPLSIATLDPLNQPTGRDLEVILLKRVEVSGTLTEREVKRLAIKTNPTTGLASIPIKIDDRDGGPYVLRVAGSDQFRNPIVADRALTISGKKDETTLRLLADRQDFKVGETASVRLFSRDASGTALIAWEADRIPQISDRFPQRRRKSALVGGRRCRIPQFQPVGLADERVEVRRGEA